MNINGWDTICAVESDYINKQLQQNMNQMLQTFDYNGNDPLGVGAYEVKGNFGPWQLVGGSDQLVYIEIPIASGSIVPSSGTPTDISGMSVTVEVNLQLLPASSGQNTQNLCFDFSSGANTSPPLIMAISASDPNNTGKKDYVEDAVVNCLETNGNQVSFVFAQIGVVQVNADTWLKPTQSAYSYQQPIGSPLSIGYLAILSVTQNQDISQLDHQIDPGLAPSSQMPLTFAISQDLFLKNVVMPLLPSIFPNTSSLTFQFNPGTGITTTGSFSAQGVKVGAITYDPQVSSLTITCTDNYLQVDLSGSCDLDMPHAHMDFSISAKNPLTYNQQSNTLSFKGDPNPTTSHTNHIPWYDYALIALTGGIGLAIFSILVPIISSNIANSLNSGSSGLSLVQSPPHSIEWQGMQDIQVMNAGLNDCFYLQGDIST